MPLDKLFTLHRRGPAEYLHPTGFVVEASTIMDPIGFATTLEDETGRLWGEPLVEALRRFRHWNGMLVMTNDDNNGIVGSDEDGRDRFEANFAPHEQERLAGALSFGHDVLVAAGAGRVPWSGLLTSHVQGTCRMGSDPERSVVDETGETWEVRRLYVGDGSLVPRTLSVNPSLTFMALASRLADHLHEDGRGYLARSRPAAADRARSA